MSLSDMEKYTVGWICALEVEYLAAQLLLDDVHPRPKYRSPADRNAYTLGEMSGHHVVIAVLPLGEYGISSATRVAADMQHTFKNIRIGLMVGIGGGAPCLERKRDIRLGDVVVSTTINGKSSVLQYDFGKNNQSDEGDFDFQLTGALNQPPQLLQSAVHQLKTNYKHFGHRIEDTIQQAIQSKDRLKDLRRPSQRTDVLYKSNIVHPINIESCAISCQNRLNTIKRPKRLETELVTIHYGRIASANCLMKNALKRDQLAMEEDILCFEMEAAGLMNHFPCLVIRGICDYSDSHKNKEWQGYAAMTAAAYAKDLLLEIAPAQVTNEKKIIDIISDLQKNVKNIAQDLEKIANGRPNDNAILDWITPVDYAPQQADLFRRRVSGTGSWFLKSTQYQTWRDGTAQTLSCQGIPGAGKTILAATVINDLFDQFQAESKVGIAYVYLNYQRPKEQQTESLLSSILKQLTQGRPLPEELIILYTQYKRKPAWPTVGELVDVLRAVAMKFTKLFIVIDALDESFFPKDLNTFIARILGLRDKTTVNLLTTSRPSSPALKRLPSDSVTMVIRADEGDVERYLDDQMSILPDFVAECDILQFTIKFKILDAIDGMFLLAHIFLNALVGVHSRKALETALENLLDSSKGDIYNMAYESAMDRIEAQPTRDIAKQVLLWVSTAHRPIRMIELKHALGIEIGTSRYSEENLPEIDLIFVCAGLVTTEEKWFLDDEATKIEFVRLVHHTTQEYFDETGFRWFPGADRYISHACITYMSYNVFSTGICETKDELNRRLETYPFYRFAAWCWGHHVQLAQMEEDPLVLEFLENENLVGSCSQAMLHSKYGYTNLGRRPTLDLDQAPGHMSGLGLAVILSLETSVTHLLLRGADIEVIDGWLRTPLCWAAWCGSERMVRLLWYKRANIDSNGNSYQTPLALASEQGFTSLAKLLIDKGASIKPKNGPQPLHLAAEWGNEETVKLLLDEGADIKSKDADGLTSLSLAISTNNQKSTEFLLRKGAKVNTSDNRGNTPLCWAIMVGNFEVVKLLLQNGADIEMKNGDGQTPLLVAVRFNRKGIVRLLLAEGADVDAKDDIFGQTALSWAAVYDFREGAMNRLIERDADFEATNKEGKTALILTVIHNQLVAAEKLLSRGASVETADTKYGRSPLLWAVRLNNVEMLRFLMHHGADINAKDKGNRTALDVALKFGSEKIIPLLLHLRGEQAVLTAQDARGERM